MSRLKAIGNRLQPAPRRPMASTNVSERRITGRTLQNRRLRLWSRDPHCSRCGRLVDYPHGFELDHRIPLHQGGPDTDENCQVLCVYMTTDMSKAGCHIEKTKEDQSKTFGHF